MKKELEIAIAGALGFISKLREPERRSQGEIIKSSRVSGTSLSESTDSAMKTGVLTSSRARSTLFANAPALYDPDPYADPNRLGVD